MSTILFWLVHFSRRLVVRASLYALFGVAVALVAVWFAPLVPDGLAERLGGDAVEGILSALATSLLAVTTFSASAVVVAYTAVSAQLTPRAAALITSDSATQRALATFIGAFLFTIVALVALGANYYGPGGRTIIFFATLLMVALVAVTLLGWIDRVSRLALHGRLLGEIETATRKAFAARAGKPYMGGEGLTEPSLIGAALKARSAGYVANIDASKIQRVAERLDCRAEILVLPGAFVRSGQDLLRLPGCEKVDEDCSRELLNAFAVTATPTFEQDPGYGLRVLVEVAARALSPGVNDPGTAVLAVDSTYRVLSEWMNLRNQHHIDPTYSRIRARDLDPCLLIEASLGEIARYGAHDVIVAERVQGALADLALDTRDTTLIGCARQTSAVALSRAEATIQFEADRERLRKAANWNRLT